jgi:hypothetical protein
MLFNERGRQIRFSYDSEWDLISALESDISPRNSKIVRRRKERKPGRRCTICRVKLVSRHRNGHCRFHDNLKHRMYLPPEGKYRTVPAEVLKAASRAFKKQIVIQAGKQYQTVPDLTRIIIYLLRFDARQTYREIQKFLGVGKNMVYDSCKLAKNLSRLARFREPISRIRDCYSK